MMVEMVEVVIDSIRISLTNQQRVVLLREVNEPRYIPIWIGPHEAESITIALQEIEIARPQTHDLLMRSIEQLKGKLLRVEVVALKGDVFYGNLVVQTGEEFLHIDSRPSDSLALAVRAHVPILVARGVLDLAGIAPEEDLQTLHDDESALENETADNPDARKRLSVFEDFLQNVELDDPGEKDPPEDDLSEDDSSEDDPSKDDQAPFVSNN
jgi:bifunctional DNase/RNase